MVSEGVTAKIASVMPAPSPAEEKKQMDVRTIPKVYGILTLEPKRLLGALTFPYNYATQ